MDSAARSRIGFAVVLLLIVGIGIAAYLNGRQFISTNLEVVETLQIQRVINTILRLAVDAETGARGFFITNDPDYLDPYHDARESLSSTLIELAHLLEENPAQLQRLRELEVLLSQRLDTLASAIERRQNDPSAQALVTGQGKRQMDDIRQMIEEMETEQEQIQAERFAGATFSASATVIVFGALTLLAALLLGGIYVVMQRHFAESQHNKQVLENRVADRTRQLQLLAEASAILSEPLAYRNKLQQIARMLVPQVGDWCVLQIALTAEEDAQLMPMAIAHHNEQKQNALRERLLKTPTQPNQAGGNYEVFRNGKTIFYRDFQAVLASVPPDMSYLKEMSSLMLIPIQASGKTLGVLTLCAEESKRIFTDGDLNLVTEIANRAGLMVENGRLFEYTSELNTELELRVIERTQQLAAINTELEAFNYSVSHDLRAPLRSIDGFSAALLEDFADDLPNTAKSYLERVRAAAQRMGHLIDDLLGLSRLTRIEMVFEEVDLSAQAEIVVAELRQADPQREIEVSIQEGMTAHCDSHLSRILLENLIGNAWKFTKRVDAPKITVGVETVDGVEAFFVRDNGAGFEMAYVARLFGAFERLHSVTEFEGTGIGLAIVQRIINRHGGRVWAQGKIGEGAVFYFLLGGEDESDDFIIKGEPHDSAG